MAVIQDLQPDTIEYILLQTTPQDIAAFSQTSKVFRDLVYRPQDDRFWREIYLTLLELEDPRTCYQWSLKPTIPDVMNKEGARRMARVNWMERVQRCSRADLTLRQTNRCRGPQEVKDICRTLLDLIHNAPVFQSDAFHPLSSEASEKREISENLLWAPVILSPGTFLDRPGAFISKASTQTPEESRPTDTKAVAELDFEDDVWPRMLDDPGNETYQLLAKLHTLFGVTSKDIFDPTHRLHSWRYVYDFDNYGFHNRFGPFMVSPKTGLLEINWVHIRAIHHAMSMHVLPGTLPEADEHSAEAQQLTYVIYPLSTPFTQNLVVPSMKVAGLGEAGLDFAEGYLSAGMDKGEREKYLKKNDWAGVEGLWECSFCFVDHRGLLEYNTVRYPSLSISLSSLSQKLIYSFCSAPLITMTPTKTHHPPYPAIVPNSTKSSERCPCNCA